MATRLFVGNLPENTEESDLRSAFSDYGEIINFDLKSKSTTPDETKKFAFVTISGSNYDIESCIKHFSNEHFNGNKLYVTRARESFLERLERERLEAKQKETLKAEAHGAIKKTPVLKLGDKLNPRKRKIDDTDTNHKAPNHTKTFKNKNIKLNGADYVLIDNDDELFKKKNDNKSHTIDANNKNPYDIQTSNNTVKYGNEVDSTRKGNVLDMSKKKLNSEMQRMEAMKKKRQEFKEKQNIVKTGLTAVDKVPNKKIIFSDYEDVTPKDVDGHANSKPDKRNTLFEDENEDSGDEVNFEIKKQFEGTKGQKVLDLQSRYKSDKRFVLDERFIEDDGGEEEKDQGELEEEDQIEVSHTDEKAKQLNILQDLLGVAIRRKNPDDERDGKKNKPKIGMLRFDPSQPEHAKFLAPVNTKQESTKKSKKKTKDKQIEEPEVQEQRPEEPRPEVSKEQFYKVSETLKEAIAKPSSFSLRSLFRNTEVAEEESKEEEASYIPLEPPKKNKVKNPLEPGEKNPFVYDSSDSETEDVKETKTETTPVVVTESKAVWKENFFFGISDQRFEEGLAFFNNTNESDAQKERRELKSLVKKRIYNKERKTHMQMFQKKIGGRKKNMKKSFRRKI